MFLTLANSWRFLAWMGAIALVVFATTKLSVLVRERQRVEAELRTAAERDRLLREMAVRIRRSLNLNEILETTVQEVRQFLQADRVFLSLCNEEGYCSVAAEAVLPGCKPVLGIVTSPTVFPQIQAAFQEGIRVVDDLSQIMQRPFMQQFHQHLGVKASIGIPILTDQRLTALLVAHQCSSPRHWQQYEVDLLEQLANQITIAIHQGELYTRVQQLNNTLEHQVAERTAQLQASLAELAEMDQLRDVFFHAIAHDLRTTLIGTLMVLDSLKAQPTDSIIMQRKVLERMVSSGETQLGKLDALLEAYLCKTEGMSLIRNRVCLPSLVQSVSRELSGYFAMNQAVLSTDIPENLPILRGDSSQVQRLFKQLLTNAVKHNPPGVHVHVQASVISGDKLCGNKLSNQISSQISSQILDVLYCTISDDGQGMSQAQCDRLFDLRLQGSRQDKQLTGIRVGLYLCQQIIMAHGGQMGVESAPGQGARFWFTLPM